MSTLGELLYALVEPVPEDAGEIYSLAAGGTLFELYGGDGHADCGLSVYCRNPLHPGPCKGWKKHLGATAPGVLAALEKVRHQKLAESRAKRSAAKSEAEKIVHGKLGHGSHPLFQKQLTVKHAKTILTGDENKAVQQASKVILNKTEIKRYAKLKAAQIAANGGAFAGVQDQAGYAKSLEDQIANALKLDNQEQSTHHLTNLLSDHSNALSAQFVNRQMPQCAKGDHDCDGMAYEALKDHLSTSVFRGLRDGNMDDANRQADEIKALGGDPAKIREWLKKEGVDLEAPEMTVTPPETPPAKVGAPVYTTLKGAGLKPGDKVYLHVVSHDGKKHAATTSDAKAANTHTVLATVDAPQGGKAVFHDDQTGEKIPGGSAAKKYFLTEAEGHPLAKPEPTSPKKAAVAKAKVDQQLGAPDKLGQKLDEAFGPAPKPMSPKVKYAHDIANGKATAGTLGTLGAYKALTKEEYDSFDESTKKKIAAWLDDLASKTSNQGLINAVAGINKKLGLGEDSTDLTPNEAAKGNPVKATEWVQPGKFDGWLPDKDIKLIAIGAHQVQTEAGEQFWLDKLDSLPQKQYDTFTPGLKDDVSVALANLHEVATGEGDLTKAAKIEDIHHKLTGSPIPTIKQALPVPEAQSSGPAPGETNELEHLLDLGASNTTVMLALESHPELYGDLPDYHKEKVKQILQVKYLVGNPEESGIAQSLAFLHKIDLADYGGEGDAFDKPFGVQHSETLTKLLEHAKPKSAGGKWALAKTKLPLYQQLTDEELAGLTPEEKDLLTADLKQMALKFKDPKKIADTAAILNKISKAHGGGAGAGGTSHVETPAKTEISATTQAVADAGTEKMLNVVAKLTGVHATDSMQEAITKTVATHLANADDAKLHAATNGPAAAIAASVTGNLPLLEPHKADLQAAIQDDLFHMLKNDYEPTPVLDAVSHWGKTKQLKANATSKITEALANHPSQQGLPHEGISDVVLGNELAKHAGEVALPPLYDPSDYQAVSGWLGTHALGNSMVDAGIDANDLYDAAGDIALTLHDEAKQKAQADYLQALFDGKTKPSGFAAELATIAESVKSKGDKQAAKSGWAPDSAALQAWKSGMYYTELKKALEGTGAGSGGPVTSTTPAEVKKAVAEAATPGGLTDVHKIMLKEAYKSFGSTAYLKEAKPEENYDNLLAVAKAYSGQEGIPELTFGKVMDAVDEQMAVDLGLVNGKLLRKKITDWLETPAGKKYVETNTVKGPLLSKLTGKIAEQKEIAEWLKTNKTPSVPGPGKFDPDVPSSAFKHITVSEGYEEHQAELKKLGKKISPAQKQALVSYSGSGASYMNSYLRTGKGDKNTIIEANHVQSAMYPTPSDKRMIRRTGWEFVPPQYRNAEALKKLVGGTFKDPAFMSTTYYQTPGGYGTGLPVVLDIEVPKGTYGFHLDHWSNFKGSENEWLMAAGQTLQIIGVEEITEKRHALNPQGGKRVVVKVRVVNGDDE